VSRIAAAGLWMCPVGAGAGRPRANEILVVEQVLDR
jgi:hypothetical protein